MHKRILLMVIMLLSLISNGCNVRGKTSVSSDIDKLYLDDTITKFLVEYGQYVPLIDLGFAVGELCQAIRERPALKNELIKNIMERRMLGITKSNASLWEREDKFFRSQLRHNKAISQEYSREIESIGRELPMPGYNNPLTDDQIKEEIKYASEAYGISEASTGALNLFVYDGERVARIIQDSPELVTKHKRWLWAMQETGIFSPFTINEILERKKTYILEKYKSSTNEILLDTINIIRNTEVNSVE